MANNKYFYRAEVWFGDKGGVLGDKKKNIVDCIPQLNNFINTYTTNNVIKIGIFKRNAITEKEIELK